MTDFEFQPLFHGALQVEESTNGRWKLITPLAYTTLVLGEPVVIVAQKGFDNDLASIPRIATPIIRKNGKHRRAAVIHDKIYFDKGKGFIAGRELTRKEADLIFLEALKVCEVSWWKRSTMYRAVRMGGWVYWNRKS